MPRHIAFAVVAVLLAGPALADENCASADADCAIAGGSTSVNDVPIDVPDVSAGGDFVVENLEGTPLGAADSEVAGEDVLYWDGDSAMVVPKDSGARVEIADW